MMKYLLFFLIISFTFIYGQKEYVPYDHLVYDFLERMNTLHIIDKYDEFSKPKTRNQIANYLLQVENNRSLLNNVDKNILNDYKIEFEYDMYGTLNNSSSVISSDNYFSNFDNEKYFYIYSRKEKFNLFVNLLGNITTLKNLNKDDTNTALTLQWGGEMRGTILNKFGFFMHGTNGNVFGNKNTALQIEELGYNFKINERPENKSFDNTYGYVTADFDYINFKLGRDRQQIGYGKLKPIIGDHSPMYDFLSMNINYNFFTFSYFHGKLLGREFALFDNEIGDYRKIEDKYIAYHRLGFNISRNFKFGVGEMIVYGNRSIDFSYLNPFAFYKSIEHDNRDRDNSLLFIDFSNNSIKGLNLFGMILIDDITFSNIGTKWWGNQTLIHTGFMSSNLYHFMPVDIHFEYLRISPYVFTHRIPWNNYTNYGYPLGTDVQPNSDLFFTKINYRLSNTINIAGEFKFMRHGANPLNPDGSIKENVGGDRLIGHRSFDSEESVFLAGERIHTSELVLSAILEPFNNLFVMLKGTLRNESKQNRVNNKHNDIFMLVSIKI